MTQTPDRDDATVFITICARNYLGFAVTLGRSVKQHQPEARFVTWLIDGSSSDPLPEDIEVGFVSDILDSEEFGHLLLLYNVRELATAVKPHCLAAELRGGASRAIYLDPDILVFRPLEKVLGLLDDGASGVLTPHVNRPLPRDGCIPDDLNILVAGVYNLGFLALGNCDDSLQFLDWWAGWLREYCFEDTSTGTFTDQKWVNFAPVFWPGFRLLRDPGYNVAYWNLPQRELACVDGHWLVDDGPLTFFHFSGFSPDRPADLSKHQDRIGVAPNSALASLLGHYASCLKAADHQQWRQQSFAPPCFDNGIALDDTCRRLYRDALQAGVRLAQPLLGTGSGSLFQWMVGSAGFSLPGSGKPRISRYLYQVYVERNDVVQRFPDVLGNDAQGFLDWLDRTGIREMNLNPQMAHHGRAEVGAKPDDEALATGVNYLGYLRSELGLGEAARGNIRALEERGVQVAMVDVSHLAISARNDWRHERGTEGLAENNPISVNILHVNADQLPVVLDHIGASFLTGRYNVGVWAWETPRFPEQWTDRFALLDEIWVGGSFMAEAIAPACPLPVVHIPHTVEVPDGAPDKASFGLNENEFVFLCMFDFASTPARKNPLGAIQAFRRAFDPADPVRLVIKSMNGHNRPDALQQLNECARGLKVTVIDAVLSGDRRYQLLRSCDAFLSLHRAEGFGLCLAEAMACGKPVIATGWSGNMDFMHVGNSFPVAFDLQELAEADPPYEAGTLWAEPDLDDAARLMQLVWRDPERAGAIAARAADDIRRHFSLAAVGARMQARLDVIGKRRYQQASRLIPSAPFSTLSLRRVLQTVWRRVWRHTPTRWKPAVRRWAIGVKRRFNYL